MGDANGYRLFAGLKGSKMITVGADESIYNYNNIADAVAAAQNNDTIYLAPEVHTLTAIVTINKPLRFVGWGGSSSKCQVTCSATLGTAMFAIELVAQSAAAEVYFQDIRFQHAQTGYDVFTVNNTAVAQTLSVVFQSCDVLTYAASASYGVNISHATAGQIITLDMGSSRHHSVSTVNFTAKNAGDRVRFYGMVLREEGNASACIQSADALAAGIELWGCLGTATKMTSGGGSGSTVKSFCSFTAGAFVVTTDLIGSQSETIVGA